MVLLMHIVRKGEKMKVLNLVLLSLLAVFFTACGSKPKCDDSDVVALAKELVYNNGGSTQIGFEIGTLVAQNKVPGMDSKKLAKGTQNMIANGGGILTYDDFKKYDKSKLNKDGLAVFKLFERATKEFFSKKPYTVMTTNESDKKITYCKAQLFETSQPFSYSAQYTDDGKIYVEISLD